MKALKFIITGMVLFLAGAVQGQLLISMNIGSPPPWGPAGYSDVRYYYLPDVEAYYDVQSSVFIYNTSGLWVRKTYLPRQYRNYDLYGGYKVVMTDYRGNAPYSYYPEHKKKYAKGYHGQEQRTIGMKPGKGNSKSKKLSDNHSNSNDNQGNSKNNGKGNDKKNKKKK